MQAMARNAEPLLDQVYGAIADPTRRAILAVLAGAIHGREHWLKLNPAPLREAARWLEHYRAFWEMRLDGLEAFLAKQQRSTTSGGARQTRQTGKGGK
jgi:hypothetical protein